ncbi:MAG: cysteine/1-D-myo-inosityl 2-amino-2-deoxy-alpha-D-glucopyranoside ligase, partial [Arthrobacter sp.]|nr:cysteine/1-D-myo-inosityl 2-amino-2-deoxy-alpha-D-glucopyranoside ligase [Arthrobacter sp.]
DSAAPLLEDMRSALGNDLDAPAALAAVDRWADLTLAGHAEPSAADQALVRDAVDALLGVEL